MDSGETSSRTRITVIGAGYLGLTHAACLAEFGHDVLAVDTDARKVAQMASGTAPFFEPGLQELLRKQVDTGRLRFTASHADAARFGDIHFLCVGTPQAPDGSADLSQVYAAADALAPHLTGPCLIAGKSTVPVGTARALAARIAARRRPVPEPRSSGTRSSSARAQRCRTACSRTGSFSAPCRSKPQSG